MTFLKIIFLLLVAIPFALFLLYILDRLMDELNNELPKDIDYYDSDSTRIRRKSSSDNDNVSKRTRRKNRKKKKEKAADTDE